jgi:hypothetical protein
MPATFSEQKAADVAAARALRYQEGGPVVRRLGQSRVAEAVVGRHRFPLAGQAHGIRNVQMAGKEVVAARGVNNAAPGFPGGVQGSLKGRRVIGLSVADRAGLPHIKLI